MRLMKKRNLLYNKWIITLLCLIGIAVGIWWHIAINSRFHPIIDQEIYRSAQLTVSQLEKIIHQHQIRTIVSLLGPEIGNSWYDNQKNIAEKNHVKMINIGFGSHELPKQAKLKDLIDKLLSVEKPALIHCYRGADRSGMAGAIALILFQDADIETAKKQFSWRYGVVPYTDSIGVQLFSIYENWLNTAGKSHTRENFLDWINNVYAGSR